MKKWPIITMGVIIVGCLCITPWVFGAIKSNEKVLGFVRNAEVFFSGDETNNTAQPTTGIATTSNLEGNSTSDNQPYQPPKDNNSTTVKLKDMRTISLSVQGHHQVGIVQTFTDNLGGKYNYGGIEVLNSSYDPESYDARYDVNNAYSSLTGTLVPNNWFDTKPEDLNIGHLEVYGDGKLLYRSHNIASDQIHPTQVNISLTNVSVVRIVLTSGDGGSDGYLGFVNAEFVK